jgi:cellulose biosynthesis protein BcsQ
VSRVIVIANFKGGTAKTTTAVNLSAGLAFIKGYRVLLVDFDPQGNASMALGVDIEALKYSIKDLITGHMTDFSHIPSHLVVERVTAQRKPPEVRIWRLRNQSAAGNRPPSTSTPHWPACLARR